MARKKTGYKIERPAGSGKWLLSVPDGRDPLTHKPKRAYKTVTSCTEEQAEDELTKFRADVLRGDVTIPSTATFGALVDTWFNQYGGRGPGTKASDKINIKLHIKPALGDMKVGKIRAQHIEELYDGLLRRKHLSPGTIDKIHQVIKGALDKAVDWEWIDRNPAERVHKPRKERFDPILHETTEYHLAFATERLDNPPMARFFELALLTGARRGELIALRRTDVDLETGRLQIKRSMAQVQKDDFDETLIEKGWNVFWSKTGAVALIEKDTKTRNRRTIGLDASALQLIKDQIAYMDERAKTCLTIPAHDGFLFSGAGDGAKPWKPSNTSLAWRRLRKEEGVKLKSRLHDLRHMHATQLIEAGVRPPAVQERVGHADLRTTFRYVHAVASGDESAVKAIEERLTGA